MLLLDKLTVDAVAMAKYVGLVAY